MNTISNAEDAEVIIDILRTANMFKQRRVGPMTMDEMAGFPMFEEAPKCVAAKATRWDPLLPECAARLWPVDLPDVWNARYGLAASTDCAQVGCGPQEWTIISSSPFQEPENTTALPRVALHAPFTSCTPDLLNTVVGSLHLFSVVPGPADEPPADST